MFTSFKSSWNFLALLTMSVSAFVLLLADFKLTLLIEACNYLGLILRRLNIETGF
jgi:hypothetical protein